MIALDADVDVAEGVGAVVVVDGAVGDVVAVDEVDEVVVVVVLWLMSSLSLGEFAVVL